MEILRIVYVLKSEIYREFKEFREFSVSRDTISLTSLISLISLIKSRRLLTFYISCDNGAGTASPISKSPQRSAI